MSAKADLFVRLQYLSAAINLPQLIDVGVAIDEHNGVANLLRKGLGIVAFNILEDFIKERSVEALDVISRSNLAFSDLTDYLQESATLGALKALAFRSEMNKKDGSDWKSIIQNESLKIHSTGNGTYALSKFSLSSTSSNVSANEVTDILKAFGISGGWATMKRVTDAIGGGLPDLAQAYNNAAYRRHSSAHTTTFNYNYPWLTNIKNEIIGIASALDILLTARCMQVNANPALKIDSHNIDQALNYRFLQEQGGIYRESIAIGGRSIKNWTSLTDAINHLQPRLSTRNEFLILLNSARRIENWFT